MRTISAVLAHVHRMELASRAAKRGARHVVLVDLIIIDIIKLVPVPRVRLQGCMHAVAELTMHGRLAVRVLTCACGQNNSGAQILHWVKPNPVLYRDDYY